MIDYYSEGRNMKKIRAIMTCLLSVFLCVILVGCSSEKETKDVSNSPYVGTWKVVRVEAMGKETTAEEVFGGDYIMELKNDGTYTVQSGPNTESGTWTETAKGPKIYADGNKGAIYKVTDGKMEIDLVIAKIQLEKQ